jgi:hypothetical protein
MKRKGRPKNFDVIIFLQLINTHGTEITPGSNIIGKDFKNHRCGHGFLLSVLFMVSFLSYPISPVFSLQINPMLFALCALLGWIHPTFL